MSILFNLHPNLFLFAYIHRQFSASSVFWKTNICRNPFFFKEKFSQTLISHLKNEKKIEWEHTEKKFKQNENLQISFQLNLQKRESENKNYQKNKNLDNTKSGSEYWLGLLKIQ